MIIIIVIIGVVVVFLELVPALLLNLSVGEVTGRVGGQAQTGQELHHQEQQPSSQEAIKYLHIYLNSLNVDEL